jgi:hypothetical protein
MRDFAQLMMGKTEVVRASNQIHAGLKRLQMTGSIARFAGQACHPFTEGAIQTLDKGSVENGPALRSVQQLLSLYDQPMSHAPRDLDDPFLLRPLDDGANMQVGPDLQARSSHTRRAFDLLSERTADTAWIGAPAVRQHEQRAPCVRTSANLSKQLISQTAITRLLDNTCDPQAGRNHHRQSHPGHHLASFHPNFIGLYMHQIKLSLFHEVLMHFLTMHSGSITPLGDRPLISPKGMNNGLDRASITQEGDHNDDQFHWLAQTLEHRSASSMKRLFADFTTIPLSVAIMDDNVARSSLASCGTRQIRATYLRRVHWR